MAVAASRGSYLTDGRRLVWVRRVLDEGTTVEDCGGYLAGEKPPVEVLTAEQIERDWREVIPRGEDGLDGG